MIAWLVDNVPDEHDRTGINGLGADAQYRSASALRQNKMPLTAQGIACDMDRNLFFDVLEQEEM